MILWYQSLWLSHWPLGYWPTDGYHVSCRGNRDWVPTCRMDRDTRSRNSNHWNLMMIGLFREKIHYPGYVYRIWILWKSRAKRITIQRDNHHRVHQIKAIQPRWWLPILKMARKRSPIRILKIIRWHSKNWNYCDCACKNSCCWEMSDKPSNLKGPWNVWWSRTISNSCPRPSRSNEWFHSRWVRPKNMSE